jgi:hypothetical protein
MFYLTFSCCRVKGKMAAGVNFNSLLQAVMSLRTLKGMMRIFLEVLLSLRDFSSKL